MKTVLKIILCAALCCFLSAGQALAQNEPQKLVEQKVNEVIQILDAGKKSNKRDAQIITELKGLILSVCDLTEMSKRALGVNYNKFSADQQKEFENLFAEMLENVYLGNLLDYNDQKVVFGKTVTLKANEAVEVQSDIVSMDGKKMPVFYRISNKSGEWKVYDVIIEGISFIKNYRDQFKEILTKNTPEELLNTMHQKNAENTLGK